MNIGTEILTSTAILGALVSVLGYFIRRWMDRIEAKMDMIMEYRLDCRARMITREEYSSGMTRMHQRLDEHLTGQQALAGRVAVLEGQTRQCQ